MGIRKKISLGFICLAVMLFFSGMISMFELNRMSKSTREILESSSENMEFSKMMLDAVQDQNTSLLQMFLFKRDTYDSLFLAAHEQFDKALAQATATIKDRMELEPIYAAKEVYNAHIDKYMADTSDNDFERFLATYKTNYQQLTYAIKLYMHESQNSLMHKAAELKDNAYRAITPGIITLCVAIMMIVVFAFLIDMYYTRPILEITKGLKNYVNFKMPFNVRMEGRDDIFQLKEYIETLINMLRNKKAE